jgi:hypothetical protein
MIPLAADRARGHVEAAIEALKVALACEPPRRWARSLELIVIDLGIVLEDGCGLGYVDELKRLGARLAGSRGQLPGAATLAVGEAQTAVASGHAALERAIGSGSR